MLRAPTRRPIRLSPIRPNLGVEAAYQKRIDAMVAQMQRSVMRAVLATYRRKPPEMAADESPAAALRQQMNDLSRQWEKRFDDFAQAAGRKFSRDAVGATDRSFQVALKKAGFTVDFKMTPAANDILQATIASQVELIKSIPAEYLTQVQGAVMRSVQTGRDMGTLAKEIEQQFGVTKRRAALIARTQNSIATASITRSRQSELGITKAIWRHSAGGKVPRPSHVKFSGGIYDIKEGWLDPDAGKRIWPGTEINCRCVSIPVIDGLD